MKSPDSPTSAAHAFVELHMDNLGRALKDAGLRTALLESRVKTDAAVSRKRSARPGQAVNDYIGFRIIVDHVGLLDDATKAILAWAGSANLLIESIDDYFEEPGAGGYRALHFDFAPSDRATVGLVQGFGIEVQLTTAFLVVIAHVSHGVLYASDATPPEDVAHRLEALAEDALRLDKRVADLANAVSVLD